MPKTYVDTRQFSALQFTGSNAFEIWAFVGDREALDCLELQSTDYPVIYDYNRHYTCKPGDWVVKCIGFPAYKVYSDKDFIKYFKEVS